MASSATSSAPDVSGDSPRAYSATQAAAPATTESTVDDEGGDECRVCRGGAELGPLFTPCKCSGSIRHVHQECLEIWLKHKNATKEVCELCDCTYGFSPRYADDAPQSLGGLSLTVALVKRVFSNGLPSLFRLLCVFSSWIIFVPLGTHWMYRIVVHSPFVSKLSEYFGAGSLFHRVADL